MAQTRFGVISSTAEEKTDLDLTLRDIFLTLKKKFKNFRKFQEVLSESKNYGSNDLKDEQEPEEFIKQNLIYPLINFLGYEIISETVLPSPSGKKKPDYTIRPKNQDAPIFYVEAEHLNKDLRLEGHGVSQVDSWLISRASKTNYGIATDGFLWIVRKFDATSAKSNDFMIINLRDIFLKILNPHIFITDKETEEIKNNFLKLHSKYVKLFLESYLEKIEEEKHIVSRKFYNDYVKLVFGFDQKGNAIEGTYLLNEVIVPKDHCDNNVNLFSVVFMNRLIFIEFLEEKGIVTKDLLKKLLSKYRASGSPNTFYEAYLRPLFFEVFNKGKESRASVVKTNQLYREIPYLNGGLFREVIPFEKEYNITNEGVELALENLLEKYEFGSENGVNPDILGYIFEKTINFISGTGSNQQKIQGAYYTPDDIVAHIIEETFTPIIFNKLLEGLKNAGWTNNDLRGYDNIDTLLNADTMPKNPIHVRKMLESLETIKFIDPACGSGHFLTAMLAQMLRIEESLLRPIDKVDRYHLKKGIISKNLFGIDIDQNAVEIARLRLWLSLIEEVKDLSHIETLPNTDFNIISGNTLIGWLNETLTKHPLINLSDDLIVRNALENLSTLYKKEIAEVKELLNNLKIDDTIKAYEKLKSIYYLESGEKAVKIKEILDEIRKKLYFVINNSFIDNLHEKNDFSVSQIGQLTKTVEERKPFHWNVDFATVLQESGFDVVIGNPPYVNVYLMDENERAFFDETGVYQSPHLKYDLYTLFVERGINLLKHNGYLGFIVPYSLLNQPYAEKLRKYILDNCCITSIADLTNYDVFKNSSVKTVIIILKKESKKTIRDNTKIKILKRTSEAEDFFEHNVISQSNYYNTEKYMFRLELNNDILDIAKKIKKVSTDLGSICYISKGIVAYSNEDGRTKDDFLHSKKENDNCVPYLEGKDVEKYKISYRGIYLEYLPDVMSRPTFRELHTCKKILVRAMSGKLLSTFDVDGYFADQKLICCPKRTLIEDYIKPSKKPKEPLAKNAGNYDEKYIVGLLNSSVMWYYYKSLIFGGLSIHPDDIRNLPIREIDFSNSVDIDLHNSLAKIVGSIMKINIEIANLKDTVEREKLEKELLLLEDSVDPLVQKIYGISDAERQKIKEFI